MKLTLAQVKERRIKKAVALLGETPVGKWAVFRRSSKAASIRFTRMYDTREEATYAAKRLSAQMEREEIYQGSTYYIIFVDSELQASPE